MSHPQAVARRAKRCPALHRPALASVLFAVKHRLCRSHAPSCVPVRTGAKEGARTWQRQVADAFGHRRGRIYRLECGRRLNEAGRTDIVVNDVLGTDQKWRNLAKRQLADVVPPADLFRWLDGRKLDAVIHMGAISDTTATDARPGDGEQFPPLAAAARLVHQRTRTPFIYASSAATYGDGAEGFSDDWSPASAAKAQADESLRLEQAPVRPGGGRALRARRRSCRRNGPGSSSSTCSARTSITRAR